MANKTHMVYMVKMVNIFNIIILVDKKKVNKKKQYKILKSMNIYTVEIYLIEC